MLNLKLILSKKQIQEVLRAICRNLSKSEKEMFISEVFSILLDECTSKDIYELVEDLARDMFYKLNQKEVSHE